MLLLLRLTCLRGLLAAMGLLRLFQFLVSLNGSTRATTGQRAMEDHCGCQEPSPARVCVGRGQKHHLPEYWPLAPCWQEGHMQRLPQHSITCHPLTLILIRLHTHLHTQAIKIPKVDVSLSIIHRKCLFLQNYYWNYQITNTVWTDSTSEITNWSNFFKFLEK